ncbi:hypothetical protein M0811_03415 [Anaeramoeba ignava]|uniref:Uncharacterized protein n=1 Tax=Anaeramoeba ignava TaxID=1746090 RepID=A0A9Q0L4Q6_ANAIG|nr:hypothetical protein M0811_03415 [Anaeramoeba ignava]
MDQLYLWISSVLHKEINSQIKIEELTQKLCETIETLFPYLPSSKKEKNDAISNIKRLNRYSHLCGIPESFRLKPDEIIQNKNYEPVHILIQEIRTIYEKKLMEKNMIYPEKFTFIKQQVSVVDGIRAAFILSADISLQKTQVTCYYTSSGFESIIDSQEFRNFVHASLNQKLEDELEIVDLLSLNQVLLWIEYQDTNTNKIYATKRFQSLRDSDAFRNLIDFSEENIENDRNHEIEIEIENENENENVCNLCQILLEKYPSTSLRIVDVLARSLFFQVPLSFNVLFGSGRNYDDPNFPGILLLFNYEIWLQSKQEKLSQKIDQLEDINTDLENLEILINFQEQQNIIVEFNNPLDKILISYFIPNFIEMSIKQDYPLPQKLGLEEKQHAKKVGEMSLIEFQPEINEEESKKMGYEWVQTIQANFATGFQEFDVQIYRETQTQTATIRLTTYFLHIQLIGTAKILLKHTNKNHKLLINPENLAQFELVIDGKFICYLEFLSNIRGFIFWKTYNLFRKYPGSFPEAFEIGGDVLGESHEAMAVALRCWSKNEATFAVKMMKNLSDPVVAILKLDRNQITIYAENEPQIFVPLDNGLLNIQPHSKHNNLLKITIERIDTGHALLIVCNSSRQRTLLSTTLSCFDMLQFRYKQVFSSMDYEEVVQSELAVDRREEARSHREHAAHPGFFPTNEISREVLKNLANYKIIQKRDGSTLINSPLLSPSLDSSIHNFIPKTILTPTTFLYGNANAQDQKDSDTPQNSHEDYVQFSLYVHDLYGSKLGVGKITLYPDHFSFKFPTFFIQRFYSHYSKTVLESSDNKKCRLMIDEIEFVLVSFPNTKMAISFQKAFDSYKTKYLDLQKNIPILSGTFDCKFITPVGNFYGKIRILPDGISASCPIDNAAFDFVPSLSISENQNTLKIDMGKIGYMQIQLQNPSQTSEFKQLLHTNCDNYFAQSIGQKSFVFNLLTEKFPDASMIQKSRIFLTPHRLTIKNEDNTIETYKLDECFLFDKEGSQIVLQLPSPKSLLLSFIEEQQKQLFIKYAQQCNINDFFGSSSWNFRISLYDQNQESPTSAILCLRPTDISFISDTKKYQNPVIETEIFSHKSNSSLIQVYFVGRTNFIVSFQKKGSKNVFIRNFTHFQNTILKKFQLKEGYESDVDEDSSETEEQDNEINANNENTNKNLNNNNNNNLDHNLQKRDQNIDLVSDRSYPQFKEFEVSIMDEKQSHDQNSIPQKKFISAKIIVDEKEVLIQFPTQKIQYSFENNFEIAINTNNLRLIKIVWRKSDSFQIEFSDEKTKNEFVRFLTIQKQIFQDKMDSQNDLNKKSETFDIQILNDNSNVIDKGFVLFHTDYLRLSTQKKELEIEFSPQVEVLLDQKKNNILTIKYGPKKKNQKVIVSFPNEEQRTKFHAKFQIFVSQLFSKMKQQESLHQQRPHEFDIFVLNKKREKVEEGVIWINPKNIQIVTNKKTLIIDLVDLKTKVIPLKDDEKVIKLQHKKGKEFIMFANTTQKGLFLNSFSFGGNKTTKA